MGVWLLPQRDRWCAHRMTRKPSHCPNADSPGGGLLPREAPCFPDKCLCLGQMSVRESFERHGVKGVTRGSVSVGPTPPGVSVPPTLWPALS